MTNRTFELSWHNSAWRLFLTALPTNVGNPASWVHLSELKGLRMLSTFSTIALMTAGAFTGGFAIRGWTQSDQGAPAGTSTTVPEETRPIPEAPSQTDVERPEAYTASLGGGLIAMPRTRVTQLIAGGSGSFAWGTDPEDFSGTSAAGSTILSPRVGIIASTARTQIVGQYQATLTRYTSGDDDPQTIHYGSFQLLSDLSPRLSLDGKFIGSYGHDSVRFLGPQQSVDVGGIAGAGTGSATYLANAGTSTNLDGSVGLNYRESDRVTLSFGIKDDFSRYTSLTGTNSVVLTTAGYDRSVSPKFSVLAYGQGAYYYGTLECTGLGAGIGFKWQFAEGSSVALSGGPQIDSSTCKSQQGFSLNAASALRLTGRSQVYILASRQPSVSYLGGGLWQTSVSGGYQRQLGIRASLSFDLSRITSSGFSSAGGYSGSYLATALNRQLGHELGTSLTFRRYQGSSGNATTTHSTGNVVMFSFTWTPEAGHILR